MANVNRNAKKKSQKKRVKCYIRMMAAFNAAGMKHTSLATIY